MNGTRLMLCCVISCLLRLTLLAVPCGSSSSSSSSSVDESNQRRNGSTLVAHVNSTNSSDEWFRSVNGVKVGYANKQLIFKYSPDGAVQSRQSDSNKIGRFQIFKRIGAFMAFIPVGIQLLQLPAAFASVKFSLIKSILVAKVALFMIFLRILLTPPRQTKIVVVKPPKEYHEHYYHHHPFEDPEDNKPGWLGSAPSWLT